MSVLSRGGIVAALAGAAFATLLLLNCSKHDQPAPASTKPGTTLLEVVDPGGLMDGEDSKPPPPSRFPELPLIEFSEGLPTTGTWLGYPLLFDFNHDGRADLIASNREEDGYNAWMAPEKGPWIRSIQGLDDRTMAYGPAAAADMDSDGVPDLVLSAHTDAVRIYLNNGAMVWKRSTSAIENPYLILDVAIGNINGDAFPDVVGIGHFKGGVSVFTGDGKGGLVRLPESATVMPSRSFGRDVELLDIDGDHRDDIAVTTNEGLKVFLTRPGQPLQWEDISVGLPKPKIGNSLYAVTSGRFTSSPTPEVAVCMVADPGDPVDKRNDIGVYAWRAQEKRWEQIDRGLARDEQYRELRAADFNSDGFLDLLVMSIESGGVFYLGDGKGGFTPKGRLPAVHGKGRVALGDIDGDGLVDVAVAIPADKDHPEAGGLHAFLNRKSVWK